MTDHSNADRTSVPVPPVVEPDAHGQAALLLAESMLHMLVARGTFTSDQALEVVQVASEVKIQVATQQGESTQRMEESLALLEALGLSLATDVA